jgi:hypothetical protein
MTDRAVTSWVEVIKFLIVLGGCKPKPPKIPPTGNREVNSNFAYLVVTLLLSLVL